MQCNFTSNWIMLLLFHFSALYSFSLLLWCQLLCLYSRLLLMHSCLFSVCLNRFSLCSLSSSVTLSLPFFVFLFVIFSVYPFIFSAPGAPGLFLRQKYPSHGVSLINYYVRACVCVCVCVVLTLLSLSPRITIYKTLVLVVVFVLWTLINKQE